MSFLDYNNTDLYNKSILDNVKGYGDGVKIERFFTEDFSLSRAVLQGAKIVDVCYCKAQVEEDNDYSPDLVEMILLSPIGNLYRLEIYPNERQHDELCVRINEVFSEYD